MRRVVQFSTGNVGEHSLRLLIERPDFELVGVHAHGEDKIGRDAAELCGLSEPTGIIATNDIDALIALKPDCVVYTALAETRPDPAIAQLVRILSSGINVVGSSFAWLVAPHHADDWLREPLERACADGNTSMYINGIDPGFSGDTLVHTALSLCGRARAIKVLEIFDYGDYDDAEYTGVHMGFGSDPDDPPLLMHPEILKSFFGGQIRSLADNLGVKLDELRAHAESWVTPDSIECVMMHVPPGRVGAIRFTIEGIRNGETVISVGHVNRLTTVSAPDWPYPPEGRPGVHHVAVTGDPDVVVNAHVGGPGVPGPVAGVIATAARVVNMIEPVCTAPSGILAAKDLPAAYLHGVMW